MGASSGPGPRRSTSPPAAGRSSSSMASWGPGATRWTCTCPSARWRCGFCGRKVLAVAGRVEIMDQTRQLPQEAVVWLTHNAEAALQALGASGEVRVRVVDDAAMSKIHKDFARAEGTTDVLTFDLAPSPPEADRRPRISDVGSVHNRGAFELDTDVLVCRDEGLRQAHRHGYSVERELLLYVVHGVLHCLGHDDHDEAAAAEMHSVEDAVLTAIGVGPVF